ncbi:hypothetical protein Taro_024122, partial [Colocasia esculenta]|nr:hypothetical protein [Colocasia esculenta]
VVVALCWLVVNSSEVEVRFPRNCVVLVSGCCGVALWVEVSVVWLVATALPSRLRCIAWLPWLRYTVVVLAGAFWWVFHNGALVVLVEVVFLFVFEFLGYAGGTSCVPMVERFASFLAPCVLCQMVV